MGRRQTRPHIKEQGGCHAHRGPRSRAGTDHFYITADQRTGRRLWRRAGSCRGTSLVAGGRLPAFQRHTQQPTHEVGRGRGGFGVYRAHQPRQRPDPGPTGPPRRLRARWPPRVARGTRRQHYGRRQQLPGPPAEPAQRCGGEIGRRHLLHRPQCRDAGADAVRPQLSGRLPRVPRPGDDHPAGAGLYRPQRAGLFAR